MGPRHAAGVSFLPEATRGAAAGAGPRQAPPGNCPPPPRPPEPALSSPQHRKGPRRGSGSAQGDARGDTDVHRDTHIRRANETQICKKNNDYKKARGAKPSSVSDRKRVGTTWPPRLPRARGRPGAATCVTTSIREGGRGELRAVAARPLRGDSRSIQIRRASSPLRPRLPPVRGRPDVAKNGCRGELHAVAARGDCIPRLARLDLRPINVFAALCNWPLHPRGPRVRGRPDVA